MQLLTDKYKPTLEHIPQDMKPVVEYVTSYTKQKKKSLLIYGPTGTGKTAAVYALAEKLGVELVEVNASDFRSADERKIQVSKQKILYNERLSYWETHSIPLSMLEDIIKYELK